MPLVSELTAADIVQTLIEMDCGSLRQDPVRSPHPLRAERNPNPLRRRAGVCTTGHGSDTPPVGHLMPGASSAVHPVERNDIQPLDRCLTLRWPHGVYFRHGGACIC